MDCPLGEKSGHCGQMAVNGSSTAHCAFVIFVINGQVRVGSWRCAFFAE